MKNKNRIPVIQLPGTPPVNERIRILIEYKGNLRSIFWLQVRKDGSLYFSPFYKKITSALEGSKTVRGNKIILNYNKETKGKILDTNKIKGGRISRHASGAIHGGSTRSFLPPAKNITEPQLEFVIRFEHPLKYPIVLENKTKKYDLCLRKFPIDENRPLIGWIFSSSMHQNKPVFLKQSIMQRNLSLGFSGLAIQDMVWQLLLTYDSTGPWPSKSWIIWRSKE